AGADLLAGRDVVDGANQLGGLLLAGLELDARVQVFGVFADDDEVDVRVFEVGADALVGLAGTHTGVKAEFLSEVDVDAAEALTDGRGNGGLEGHLVGLDRLEHALGDLALGLDDFDAALLHVPIDLHAGGIDALAGGFGNFRTNTVTGDQRDLVHGILNRAVRAVLSA